MLTVDYEKLGLRPGDVITADKAGVVLEVSADQVTIQLDEGQAAAPKPVPAVATKPTSEPSKPPAPAAAPADVVPLARQSTGDYDPVEPMGAPVLPSFDALPEITADRLDRRRPWRRCQR